MPASQNYSNCLLNTGVSAPRYDKWCKIQETGLADDHSPAISGNAGTSPKEGISCRCINGVVPIVIVILTILCSFLMIGFFAGDRDGIPNPFSLEVWKASFETASHYTLYILAGASLIGLLTAASMAFFQKLLSVKESAGAALSGIGIMKYAFCILLLAWSMRDVCSDLGTAIYLSSILSGTMNPLYIPLGTFIIASAISFATGTSWGTMGLLLPTIVPVAFQLGDMNITYLCLAAVLDGAIFGDHCSPISDTTIISSLTSGCSCMNHVVTQIPYGLLAASLAVSGHLVSVFTALPSWLIFFLGAGGVVLFLLIFGRNPER